MSIYTSLPSYKRKRKRGCATILSPSKKLSWLGSRLWKLYSICKRREKFLFLFSLFCCCLFLSLLIFLSLSVFVCLHVCVCLSVCIYLLSCVTASEFHVRIFHWSSLNFLVVSYIPFLHLFFLSFLFPDAVYSPTLFPVYSRLPLYLVCSFLLSSPLFFLLSPSSRCFPPSLNLYSSASANVVLSWQTKLFIAASLFCFDAAVVLLMWLLSVEGSVH